MKKSHLRPGKLPIVVRLSSLLVASLLSTTLLAGSWPTYRADAARSGVTSERLGAELALRWVYRPLHAPKPAWPPPAEELARTNADNAYHVAIDAGHVYFGSSVTGKVVAVDAEEGTVTWTFFAQGPVRFAPTIAAGRVYFGSDDGHAYSLDAASGELIWKVRAGPSDEKILGNGRMISLWPVRTSVLVADGTAYFAAGVFPYEGLYVCALNTDDGSEVWKNDTVGDRAHELEYGGISPHGYLLASSDVLYVPSGRAMPAAFDRRTGKFLFYASPGSKRGGTWALLDQGRLIAGVDHSGTPEKVVYDGRTGERKGDAFAWFPGIDMSVTPETAYIVTRDGLVATNRQAYARAVEESSQLAEQRKRVARELAAWKKRQSQNGEPTRDQEMAGKIAALTASLGDLSARREQLRKSSYRWRFSQQGLTSVVRSGDSVLAGGLGTVLRIAPDTGEIVWRQSVDGSAVGLAVADGQLLVSTDTGYVYCFGAPLPAGQTPRTVARAAAPADDDALAATYREAAKRIVADAGITKGYALVLDCGEGRLACELAQRTELKVIGIEKDPAKLAVARARAEAAGLLGARVVIEPWDLESLPDWF
ncbi:MAG: PQQ-binding-like beta-propeller repeat protein, partial [Pirellulales bacterium]